MYVRVLEFQVQKICVTHLPEITLMRLVMIFRVGIEWHGMPRLGDEILIARLWKWQSRMQHNVPIGYYKKLLKTTLHILK